MACELSVFAIQSTDGSNPRRVTVPAPDVRSAATTRVPTVARARPEASSPDRAGSVVAVGGSSPRMPARLAAGTSVVTSGR